jgi:hypothetical protein
MTWEAAWLFFGPLLAALIMGVGTFTIIHMDEKPRKKGKR